MTPRNEYQSQTDDTDAQLMFATDNEVPITGLFDAESDENPY